jgi:hypothetical protein
VKNQDGSAESKYRLKKWLITGQTSGEKQKFRGSPNWGAALSLGPVLPGDAQFEEKVLDVCREIQHRGAHAHRALLVLLQTYGEFMWNRIHKRLRKISGCFGHSQELLNMSAEETFTAAVWNIFHALTEKKLVVNEITGFTWFVKKITFQCTSRVVASELTRKRVPQLRRLRRLRRWATSSKDPYFKKQIELIIEREQDKERSWVYDEDAISELAVGEPNPEVLYQSREISGLILDLAKKLENTHVRVYAQYILDDVSQVVIAKEQNVKPPAVSKRMDAFRAEIRARLDENGIDPNTYPI